jgi:MscS family membrane protein
MNTATIVYHVSALAITSPIITMMPHTGIVSVIAVANTLVKILGSLILEFFNRISPLLPLVKLPTMPDMCQQETLDRCCGTDINPHIPDGLNDPLLGRTETIEVMMSETVDCSNLKSRPWRVFLWAILLLCALGGAEAGLAAETGLSPLSPPDTSSPAATLKSFRDNMDAAYRAFYESPVVPVPVGTPSKIRAIRCLDTSQLPPAEAARLPIKKAIQLNEVLDHVVLPQYDQIPDIKTLRSAAQSGPIVYRIPNTEIAIVEIETGPRKGEFLFSAATVERIGELYERSIPMTPQPHAMKGLHKLFSVAPGPMISRAFIERLPVWMNKPVLDQAVWKWLATVAIIGIWCLTLTLAHRYSRRHGAEHRYWRRFILALGAIGLTKLVQYLITHQIILVDTVFVVIDLTLFAVAYVLGAIMVVNLAKAIANTIVKSQSINPKRIDARLISISCDVVAWVLVIILMIKGAHELGMPIEAIIGSLGVGGIAGALAARPTLENLIAGVTLYLDKPVRIGDYCQFGDVIGGVEEIGLRSTRIRQWDGNLITVPNSQFADFQLINYNDMNYILFRSKFGLRLETSPDQLRFVLAKLREMLFAHPKVNWPRLRLAGFGEYSLVIQLVAYVDTLNWGEYHGICEDIYFRTLEIIEEAGVRLAVPVQLNYESRDTGKNEELVAAAEAQVRVWREAGELPFPDMTEPQREALHDTLDYPPKGSPGYKPDPTRDPET